MKVSELAPALVAIENHIATVQNDLTTILTELRTSLSDVELPADAVAAISQIEQQVSAMDNIIVPVTPTPEPTAP